MKPVFKCGSLMALGTLALGMSAAAHAQPNGTLVADLVQEWQETPNGRQPLGSWRLLRGSATATPSELMALNRYENGVGGQSDISVWSYGDKIFNQPGFLLDKGADEPSLQTHPEQDLERNDFKGTPYIEWTSAQAQRVAFRLRARNAVKEGEAKGGDGMTIRVLREGPAGELTEVENLTIASSAKGGEEWMETSVDAEAAQGEKFLFKIDPKVDGFGDRLSFNIQVFRQP